MPNTNGQAIRDAHGTVKLFEDAALEKQAASRKVGEDDPADSPILWSLASFHLNSQGGYFEDDPVHREYPRRK